MSCEIDSQLGRGASVESFVDPQSLLDALDGIAYLTSRTGEILAYGTSNWDDFANQSGAPELTKPENLLGRRLVEFISGEPSKSAYLATAEAVLTRAVPRLHYTYRCDAPDLRRTMRFSMTAVRLEDNTLGLLHQSILLKDTPRDPLPLFERPVAAEGEAATEIVSICSYCRSVRYRFGDGEQWIDAEEYYSLGGRDDLLVSHGICPGCWEAIVAPSLAALRA